MNRLTLFLVGLGVLCFLTLALAVLFLSWMPFMWVLTALGLGTLGLAAYRERETLVEFFATKTTKNGMSMGVMILLVIFVLVTLNFISVRHAKTFDITQEKLNSLSDQSLQLLSKLDEELLIRFFYVEGNAQLDQQRGLFRSLAKLYEQQSKKIKLEFVEMNARPDLTEQYKVKEGAGVVFMDYKGQRNRVDEITEQAFTQVLSNLVNRVAVPVYFVEGHGERDANERQVAEGLGNFKNLLEGSQYKVKSLNLLNAGKVPEDAKLLIIAGAESRLFDQEQEALIDYLNSGGSLFVAMEPGRESPLERVLESFGVAFNRNFVFQVFGNRVVPNQTPGRVEDLSHPITKVFDERANLMMSFVGGLSRLEKSDTKVTYKPLIKSYDSVVAFKSTDFKGEPIQGQVYDFVALLEKDLGESKMAKLMVSADVDFLNNGFLDSGYINRDFALNSVAYLAGQEGAITIRPKNPEKTEMTMLPSHFQVLAVGFWLPLPLMFLGLAIFLFFRRRAN